MFDFQRTLASEWKNEKIAANLVKFCPGETCREHLPLHHFASNANMSDGLDIYCTTCNAKRREERKLSRVNTTTTTTTINTTIGRKCVVIPDLFEKSVSTKVDTTSSDTGEDPVFREIHKRISTAVKEAQLRFRKKLPIEPSEISRHLFLAKKVFCKVSGAPLTPACFLDHHSITFEVVPLENNKCKADVICSNTMTSSAHFS